MIFAVVLLLYVILFTASIAIGQEFPIPPPMPELALFPDCLNVQEVFLTWGWFGKVTAAVVAGLVALRPLSQSLLAVSTLLGPRAVVAARVFYGLGQAAGMFCVSKPEFAARVPPPSAAPAKVENPQPDPPKQS